MKIQKFTDERLVSYRVNFVGIRLTDIEFKDEYASMPVEDLLEMICGKDSGLAYRPAYADVSSPYEGSLEWTYVIGVEPIYEIQIKNNQRCNFLDYNLKAPNRSEGMDNMIRPAFADKDSLCRFIAEKIQKYAQDSLETLAANVHNRYYYLSAVMAKPENVRTLMQTLDDLNMPQSEAKEADDSWVIF